jgi:molybdate transport system regulatory protein
MNKQWEVPLVTTSTGGEHGGGAKLTELGGRVLRSYRDLQVQIEAAIDRETEGFQRATRVK